MIVFRIAKHFFLLLLSVGVSYEGLFSGFMGSLSFSLHSESLFTYCPPLHLPVLTSFRQWKPSQIFMAFVSCYLRRGVFLETQAHLIHSQHNPYVLDSENIMEEGTGRF